MENTLNNTIEGKKKILITGAAGFIGFHLALRLIREGHEVWGLDNINDYYPVYLKYARCEELGIRQDQIAKNKEVASDKYNNFRFVKTDLTDREKLFRLFEKEHFDIVVNLAAQVGVRYSIENPLAYVESNLVGFAHLLEACRHFGTEHLVFASSSSVYGMNQTVPFSTGHNVDHPISLYAATKKSNELMAHSYSHLYQLPVTGLRFFTVYGPWGRPDMAAFLFVDAIFKGKSIKVFNHGQMSRDFTYVADIVEGISRVMANPPNGNPAWSGARPDPASSKAPYRIYNIGENTPVNLLDFIQTIEKLTGKKANMEMLPLQDGDMVHTFADIGDLERDFHYQPKTGIEEGLSALIDWYKTFFKTS